MKKELKVHGRLLFLMRASLIQILILGFFITIANAEVISAQVLDKKLSMEVENTSLREVLSRIEKLTKIKFLYQSRLIPSDELVTIKVKEEKLSDILNELLLEKQIKYELKGKHIVLTKESFTSISSTDSSVAVFAIDVSGVVLDENNEPLPGVNILVKGTTIGTTSDSEGKFTVDVPDESAVLVFSFIGYASTEVAVGTQQTLSVVMQPDIQSLQEVVVVGYGTQKRQDLTGAIGTVKGSDIGKLPVASITQAMQGQVAGVEVLTNNGAPGANVSVRIRGVGTINSTDPLYVVDGLPIFGGLNQINPNDIESIDILKDASAGAIYGARAANGVVLITTKKGKEGPLQVSFSSYYGTQTPWKKLDLMNDDEYRRHLTAAHANSGTVAPPALTDPARNGINTDWQDLMLSSASIQNYNLNLSGGNQFATFNISGGYFRQGGILNNTGYERANIRINSQGKKGRFKFGESLLVAGDVSKPEATFSGGTMFSHMMNASPLVAPRNPLNLGGFGGAVLAEDNMQFLNPYGYSSLFDGRDKGIQVLGSIYGQIEIIKGLDYRLNLGTDIGSTRETRFVPTFNMNVNSNNAATLSYKSGSRLSWLTEHTLTYHKVINQHDLTFLAGTSDQYLLNDNFGASGDNFPSNDVRVLNAASRANKNNEGDKNETFIRSFFARINYAFADRYLLTATIRRDGSSNFSADNRYGNFPSVSAGWVVSEEEFLKNSSIISFLKLRGSYGLLGNQNIGAYNDEATLNQSSNYVLGNGQSVVTGIVPRKLPSDAKWETTKQTDIGLELGLLNDKFVLNADYFDRQTEDMLIAANIVPFTTGLPELPFINAGGISNRGLELALTYKNQTGGLTYSISGNFTTFKNEVTSLGQDGKPIFSANSYTKTEVGSSIGRFWGYVAEGIYQSEGEIDTKFAPKAMPGDIRFRDKNSDGLLTDEDRNYIGSPLPKFTYGLNANLGYKGFDFSMLWYGVYGNDIINTLIPALNSNVNTTTDALNAWTPENRNTDVPRAVIGDPNGNLRQSSRYIESGSFLRLRNVTIGYRVPTAVVENLKLSGIRIYVSGQNLLTFTEYSGFDPETANGSAASQFAFGGSNNTANLLRGLDRGTYPLARTILGGIQIDF